MTMPADWKPDPVLSALGEERILWKGELATGWIWKRVVKALYLTNMRASAGATVMLKDVDAIVVANKHQITEYRGSSHRYDYIWSNRLGFQQHNLQSTSKTIGDVIFMRDGQAAVTFYGIEDPDGVAELARAARGNIQDILNSIGNEGRAEQIICLKCNYSNLPDSRFCNSCGNRLVVNDTSCPKCGMENPKGAASCAGCGLHLD